jgi:hypothetical protein
MSEPRKTTKARATGAGPEPQMEETVPAAAVPAAPPPVAPPVVASAPPAPAAYEAVAPAAPTPGAPAPAPAPAPAGPPAGAQVAAAISGLTSTLKERLSGPELMLGAGALLIFGASFLLLDFLLGTFGPSEGAVVVSGLLLAFIALERTQTQGFGSWYKVVLVLLGAILALGAMYSFLTILRHSASYLSGLDWLSALCWWIGGALAGVGSWLSFKVKA